MRVAVVEAPAAAPRAESGGIPPPSDGVASSFGRRRRARPRAEDVRLERDPDGGRRAPRDGVPPRNAAVGVRVPPNGGRGNGSPGSKGLAQAGEARASKG